MTVKELEAELEELKSEIAEMQIQIDMFNAILQNQINAYNKVESLTELLCTQYEQLSPELRATLTNERVQAKTLMRGHWK